MTLSEIDRTLREIRVAPVKTLGQNFLHDRNLARWIVERAEIGADDLVVEIGPGLGALTEHLLATGASVIALEKDGRLANFLGDRFAKQRIEVIHGDALHFDVRTLFAHRSVKLVGNLPYYIASQLLIKFTRDPTRINLLLLMLQKEMARRVCAAPGTADYGALTLQLQLRFRVEYLRTVSPSVFVPRPDVESALVRLERRRPDELPPVDVAWFTKLVRLGFSQRRKQLRKLLQPHVTDWERVSQAARFDPQTRAESLSLEQWITIAQLSDPAASEQTADEQAELFPVVDGEDVVMGSATRREVHANNLRHRAVHLFLFNRSGELFLQQRSRWKDRHPLQWDSSAAGHVHAGEDYDDAAGRELLEELGVATALKRIAKLPASANTGEEFIWLYRGEHDGPFKLHPREIESGEFFAPDTVRRWIAVCPGDFAPGFIECWKAFAAG